MVICSPGFFALEWWHRRFMLQGFGWMRKYLCQSCAFVCLKIRGTNDSDGNKTELVVLPHCDFFSLVMDVSTGFYHYICLQETTCTALHEARGITNMFVFKRAIPIQESFTDACRYFFIFRGEVQGCESCNQLVQQAYLSKYFSSLVRPTYLSATHFPGKD